ncbi:hypothetical protein F5Y15DRAFT_137513 [Xylariaceae sp. FL0016]|nr:hypothetical protein F5Y15DRAFT_137513 [Xylariaceae sp. FL0016]
MSNKITPKNLSYDTSLPPFLARLRGQHTSAPGPDPLLAAHRRPSARKRTASEEAEDAPLVLDDQGNVVELDAAARRDLEDGSNEGRGDGGAAAAKSAEAEKQGAQDVGEEESEKEKVASIGAIKKRKAGRVVGGDSSPTNQHGPMSDSTEASRIQQAKADVQRLAGEKPDTIDRKRNINDIPAKEAKGDKCKPVKKKAKIKLSFGDDD